MKYKKSQEWVQGLDEVTRQKVYKEAGEALFKVELIDDPEKLKEVLTEVEKIGKAGTDIWALFYLVGNTLGLEELGTEVMELVAEFVESVWIKWTQK
jgi:hypothetical protein